MIERVDGSGSTVSRVTRPTGRIKAWRGEGLAFERITAPRVKPDMGEWMHEGVMKVLSVRSAMSIAIPDTPSHIGGPLLRIPMHISNP
jgi:hypothetical protein